MNGNLYYDLNRLVHLKICNKKARFFVSNKHDPKKIKLKKNPKMDLIQILAVCPRVIRKLIIDYIHPEFVNLLDELVPHVKHISNTSLIPHPDEMYWDWYVLGVEFRYCEHVIEILAASSDKGYKLHKYLYNSNLTKILTRLKLGWVQSSDNAWHRQAIHHLEPNLWELLFETDNMKVEMELCQLHSNCIMIKT